MSLYPLPICRMPLTFSNFFTNSKFPDYPPSTLAFQKISFAYETLSKPSSRRIYDVSGRSDLAASMQNGAAGDGTGFGGGMHAHGVNEETLNGVLYSVFCEFMEGDFEMVRVMINALNEGNPGLDLGDDAVENLEGAFRKMRAVVMGAFGFSKTSSTQY